ncbi:site-specific integrase [Rhizobium laguerreae]|uniref:site-specific integrase n=1 Tax=Rhizobium laguerreae TaxID=1076926 RepID=UPI001C91F4C9|nr:site-specific integrase [Rhizobium laguerreae]MBY3352788.1 site-specific integrase [Rhizobium laguerreae]MBY3451780.1 site-specific integrase [Rhizobium laguerreae]MBY3458948.1 site-specific integrase [Rhizobium laguerreae]
MKKLSHTVLISSDRDFRVDGKPVGLMPLVVNEEEGPVTIIQAWILDCMVRIGEPWISVEKNVYIICQWYDFLRYRGVATLNAYESHLRDFLLGGGVRESNVRSMGSDAQVTGTVTNRNKYRVIVGFHDFWENRYGKSLAVRYGGTLAQLRENAFDRKNRSVSRAEINFSKPENVGAKTEPGTPTLDEGELILEEALNHPNPNRAQTWYLIGSLALRGGARVGGINSITAPGLISALKKERAFKKVAGYAEMLDGYLRPGNRAKIKEILRGMRADRRTFIFCEVRSKGGKLIPLPIPIEVCEELIEYICTFREEIKAAFLKAKCRVPPNIFLSNKKRQAGGALTSRAMSNFFNPIFKRLDIDGTIHRLRATFAEAVVRDCYIRERGINGRAWQIKNVLQFASKLLGHDSFESIQDYLNNIIAQELLAGHPVIVGSEENASYLRAVAEKLDDAKDEAFKTALERFFFENGLKPVVEEGRKYSLF